MKKNKPQCDTSETEYTIYRKNKSLGDYIYDDIDPHALKMAEEHGMDNIQFNIYNFLCRGEFLLRNDDADMYFNPKSKGIGWSHDRNWAERKTQPLIKAGLVSLVKERNPNDRRYINWFFHDSRYRLDNLAEGSCFVTNSLIHDIRKGLGLDYGWWWRIPATAEHNGIRTTVRTGYVTVGTAPWKRRRRVTKITMECGRHKRMIPIDSYCGYATDFIKIKSFIDMVGTVGKKELRMIETTADLEEWFRKQYGDTPTNTTHRKYSPKWTIRENKFHDYFDDGNPDPAEAKWEIHVKRVEGGSITGFGGVDRNRNHYGHDITISEDELNRHGFTCQKPDDRVK